MRKPGVVCCFQHHPDNANTVCSLTILLLVELAMLAYFSFLLEVSVKYVYPFQRGWGLLYCTLHVNSISMTIQAKLFGVLNEHLICFRTVTPSVLTKRKRACGL